ncbi:sensor histidine kinase [Kiloniella laminariae]|uniref:sensor histidine kinase n=1 Tax=Kiloniella laminariae TaxID=454162 RepID=UPI00037C42BB|nr:ATP-binding protein [Kiloniella laminariae]
MFLPNRHISLKMLAPWLGALAVGAVLVISMVQWVGQTSARELSEVAVDRLKLYHGTLHSALEKHRYLPFVLSRDDDIQELLTAGDGRAGLAVSVSRSLSATNQKAESDVLYVLNSQGTTLAASNWLEDRSFVGHNYAFRPYYKDAIEGRESGFFAVGATTGVPGFFMSHAVPDDDKGVRGVIVVKVDLRPLQQQWHDGGEHVIVTDQNGVIFLSSRDEWRYRSLSPIDHDAMQRIRSERQFAGADLAPLGLKRLKVFGEEVFEIDGQRFLVQKGPGGKPGWEILYLAPFSYITERQHTVFLIGSVLLFLFLTGGLFIRERRQKLFSAQRAREADRIEAINEMLRVEVEERKRTETRLLKIQSDLVQTGKLAALGQMSAAIAHEINQPMAAIRTFTASARVLLGKGKREQLGESLAEISSLTERMSKITGELKTFARKAPVELQEVDLRVALSKAIQLMQAVCEQDGVVIYFEDTGPITRVKGDVVRLEQVFVNLLRNAADALRFSSEKQIKVILAGDEKFALVRIEDSGPGIDVANMDQLFDPFFTTKDVGEGMGLGLSISYGIVQDLGGDIRAENIKDSGACFVVEFPLVNFVEQPFAYSA